MKRIKSLLIAILVFTFTGSMYGQEKNYYILNSATLL